MTLNLTALRASVAAAAPRVAELGGWPPYISPGSLLLRVPTNEAAGAGGFDAGIACSLDLIPRPAQQLAATLHAAYTPAAVVQVRKEALEMIDDSSTTWWLAACSVCEEGEVDAAAFTAQLARFEVLRTNRSLRTLAALKTHAAMLSSFEVVGSVAYALADGGMQGAYLAGHQFAVHYAADYGFFFLGTPQPSLGLEDFAWSDPGEPGRPGRSGPVHGSRQFVKCADQDELDRALAALRL